MDNTLLYKKVAVELNCIFNNLDYCIWVKIPNEIKQYVKENQDVNYTFIYDKSKSLNEQKMHKETKEIFSSLYLEYCCNKQTKEELLEITKENEQKWKEKYSYENLFKNTNIEQPSVISEETPLVVEKKSKFKKFIDKIKRFFNIKK